jgi:DNA-binding response OmpR family regulator
MALGDEAKMKADTVSHWMPHLLLVEDDRRLASLLSRGLEEDGYRIDTTGTLGGALRCSAVTTFDGAIIDVMLPDGNGIDLAGRLRARGFDAPILILTARAEIELRVEGLDAGADDYVVKPVSLPELGARLRALHRRWRGRAGRLLRAGDLVLEPPALTAMRGDTEIDLTPTECRLLEAMMRHPGQVLSRTQLATMVWDDGLGPPSNAIDVHIRSLRLKVDLPFGTNTIETVRGMGYRVRRGAP